MLIELLINQGDYSGAAGYCNDILKVYSDSADIHFWRIVLERLIEENNGYLLTSMAIEKDITKLFLSRYVKEMGMEKVARGVYITDDVWPDELFVLQLRSSAVIFSGETALFYTVF